jgi:hypothetical protein
VLVPLTGLNDFVEHVDLMFQCIALLLGARRFSSNLSQTMTYQLRDIIVGEQSLDIVKKDCFDSQNGCVVDERIQRQLCMISDFSLSLVEILTS